MATSHGPSANYIPPGHVKSNADDNADVVLWANPSTHRLLVDASISSADTELPAAAVLADNTANPTAPAVASFPHWYDGTTWDRALGNATDGLLVNLGSNNDVSLNAGTNAIGKLAANSGVDIGDVDVTSIAAGDNNIGNVDIASITNGSLNGPGSPTIDSYTHAAINLAAAADQVLVSSAANKQIWVYGISFVVNAAGTVSFQDEDNTAITGVMPFAANSGLAISPSGNFAMPIWKLATDKDLEVDIVTSEVDGYLDYAIVSV